MADDKEHKMLFDLRGGRRRNVVKVVYATLAVLMGLSLFLVIGGFNIAELFNGNGTSQGDAAEPYEEQAERIEARLKKDPDNPDLLLSLTRAHVNAANTQVTVEPNGFQTVTTEGIEQYELAYQSWSDYLKATDEPNPSLALLMSSALVQMTEFAQSFSQAETRIKSAVEAQEIVAEERPTLNAYSTLALYTYFTGDIDAAEKARAEAKKLAGSKAERDAIDKQLDEVKGRAQKYLQEKKQAEKAAAAGGGQGKEALENPLGLSGGGGLTE